MTRLALATVVLVLGLVPGAQSPSTLPLVQKGDLLYQGAFRYPQGAPVDAQSFQYGGTALTYYAPHDSLYAVGFDVTQYAAELTIPAIRSVATVGQLAEATFRQPITDPLHGQRNTVDGDVSNSVKIGGMLPSGSDLIVSAYTYYDGAGTQSLSHFRVPADLNQTSVVGPVAVANSLGRAGFVFGYMLTIPPVWQPLFGGPAFSGGCCKAIIGRTSLGPSLTVFNPANVGSANPVPGTTVLGYPITHPTLGIYEGGALYNGGVTITGAVFPDGTRSVLFFGRNATASHYCYGAGTTNPALNGLPDPDLPGVVYCYDQYDQSKGPHNYPYSSFVWAYDANDLLLVKNGTKQPWEIVPYATWGFTTPFMTEVGYNAGHTVKGVAYKATTQQLFISEEGQDGCCGPIVHVFGIGAGSTPPPPAPGPDLTKPTVALVTPSGLVAGVATTIIANAADNLAVARVDVSIDGLLLKSITAAPYTVSWTPTAGAHTVAAIAVDTSNNLSLTASVVVTAAATPPPQACALTMAPATLSSGTVGTGYYADVTVHNGTGPYTLGVSAGSTLPPGLSIGLMTGLTGTPTAGGAFSFALHATDGKGCTLDQPYALTVTGITPPPPPPPPPLTAPAPTVSVAASQCAVSLSAPPPNTSGGWSAQFRRDGVNVGAVVATAPYAQTTTVGVGTSAITVVWTKTGQAAVTSPSSSAVCR